MGKTLHCYIKVPVDNYRHDFKVEVEEEATEQEVISAIIHHAVLNIFKLGAEDYDFTEHGYFIEGK